MFYHILLITDILLLLQSSSGGTTRVVRVPQTAKSCKWNHSML